MTDDAPRSANLPPGYDDEDPYADEDLSAYPEWWQRNIGRFQAHGMRPYRPPRFKDEVIIPDRVKSLEVKLDIEIRFRAINPQYGGKWELMIDGEAVASVDHEREGEGFTVYGVTSDEFEELVRSAVEL